VYIISRTYDAIELKLRLRGRPSTIKRFTTVSLNIKKIEKTENGERIHVKESIKMTEYKRNITTNSEREVSSLKKQVYEKKLREKESACRKED